MAPLGFDTNLERYPLLYQSLLMYGSLLVIAQKLHLHSSEHQNTTAVAKQQNSLWVWQGLSDQLTSARLLSRRLL